MASIRKRGSSYLLVVSMGYDYEGNRIRPKQKTVHPPEGLTPKQREKWLKEQAVLFERECRSLPQEEVDRSITLAKYTDPVSYTHLASSSGMSESRSTPWSIIPLVPTRIHEMLGNFSSISVIFPATRSISNIVNCVCS